MKQVLFLNLTAFSQTGGIERFNKCFLKALNELDMTGETDSYSISAYDKTATEHYYPKNRYKCFATRKVPFVLSSIMTAGKYDVIFIGHVNLAIVGVAIKYLYPSKKVILITHGIEVWQELKGIKRKLLYVADKILSVSNFTRKKIEDVNGIKEGVITVFPNTIDPYFPIPDTVRRSDELRKRYGLSSKDFVIYTLTRISDTELFKGYDKVIEALSILVKEHPQGKYVIAGKYDAAEKARIDTLVAKYKLQGHVVLTGFLREEELVAHYQMADVYIMPSRKEGFGIVFIEALVCGVPVIAGNADGSVDALINGELGTLVDPNSVTEIGDALKMHIENNRRNNEQERSTIRQKTLDNFSFNKYKQRLSDIIAGC
ncbi:MAG: glycosyltransferase family 4 protein [Chitinophagaceae bacterium]|nr:glycosyltransferase family 4 protein [Chitinophagaceae bacterium]MCB9046948.1 glycosyltransferase family 4 protein [Chitinophagales bacterium]